MVCFYKPLNFRRKKKTSLDRGKPMEFKRQSIVLISGDQYLLAPLPTNTHAHRISSAYADVFDHEEIVPKIEISRNLKRIKKKNAIFANYRDTIALGKNRGTALSASSQTNIHKSLPSIPIEEKSTRRRVVPEACLDIEEVFSEDTPIEKITLRTVDETLDSESLIDLTFLIPTARSETGLLQLTHKLQEKIEEKKTTIKRSNSLRNKQVKIVLEDDLTKEPIVKLLWLSVVNKKKKHEYIETVPKKQYKLKHRYDPDFVPDLPQALRSPQHMGLGRSKSRNHRRQLKRDTRIKEMHQMCVEKPKEEVDLDMKVGSIKRKTITSTWFEQNVPYARNMTAEDINKIKMVLGMPDAKDNRAVKFCAKPLNDDVDAVKKSLASDNTLAGGRKLAEKTIAGSKTLAAVGKTTNKNTARTSISNAAKSSNTNITKTTNTAKTLNASSVNPDNTIPTKTPNKVNSTQRPASSSFAAWPKSSYPAYHQARSKSAEPCGSTAKKAVQRSLSAREPKKLPATPRSKKQHVSASVLPKRKSSYRKKPVPDRYSRDIRLTAFQGKRVSILTSNTMISADTGTVTSVESSAETHVVLPELGEISSLVSVSLKGF